MNSTQTILSISHGAGPLPILGDEGHIAMVENLKNIAQIIQKPSAIVVVSAHWEQSIPTVLGASQPELFFDYYGFPEESYEILYPAPGHPELAANVTEVLTSHNIDCATEMERGLDHGVFIPLKIMYPMADIPCTQLSLKAGLSPADHIAMGKALASLTQENLLIIGSGFTFHNMRAFFAEDTPQRRRENEIFEQWLIETCTSQTLSARDRNNRLLHWEKAPYARYCHPREEHLLPLHVCCGAAGRPASDYWELTIFGKKASTYLWRSPRTLAANHLS